MAEASAISWTDSTFNGWMGCTAISPACDLCYARTLMQDRHGRVVWGPGQPRVRTKTWNDPLKWERQHPAFFAEHGRHRRVFCSSLADVFDNEVPEEWRTDLWALIRKTPNLRWLLLTKRIGNAKRMLPTDFYHGTFPHVAIGSTIVTQDEWDRDFHKLMAIDAATHFVSVEPMLGKINIGRGSAGFSWDAKRVDWIITGGESGRGFRPLDMDAVRDMRDQCAANGITFHHKQNGGLRGKDSGCLVDGIEHKHFPPALAA